MRKIENPPTLVQDFSSMWKEWIFKFYEAATRNTLVTFDDGDTTPSVKNHELFKTANTGSTTITTFDDGYVNQHITVIFGDNNTIVNFTTGNLKSNTDSNLIANADDHITCVFDGTNWYCQRS